MPDEVAIIECPVCQHPEHTSLETQVLKGQITKRELADIVGCRVDTVYNHMTQHLVKRSLTDVSSKRNVLLDSLHKLNENLEHLAEERNYGQVATKQLVQLAAEVRHTIMSLSELEGAKSTEQHITIQEYNDFRSIVVGKLDKLCPTCRKLFEEDLEEPTDADFTVKT